MNPTKIESTILVIFGISGDLSRKKLIPALFNLFKQNYLPNEFKIIGLSRQNINLDEFFNKLNFENEDPLMINNFKKKLSFVNFDPQTIEDYKTLKTMLVDQLNDFNCDRLNLLLYLSIPPNIYSNVVRNLGQAELNENNEQFDVKLLVEKPFGYDLKSAEKLINDTKEYFTEDQVFRIDHYLAKDTAQNILTFRRYNPLFQTAWNNQHIKDIKIIALEQIGIEGRAKFYESIGALRDLIQSHLLQLMALITLTLPKDLANKESIHLARHDILSNLKPFINTDEVARNVLRGQYETYRQEVDNVDSMVETYASVTVEIENSIWKGVPITLTTGKGMDEKRTEIIINFTANHEQALNKLTFRIQPNEGIGVYLTVKKPGLDRTTETVSMDFSYKNSFKELSYNTSYEKVIIDVLNKDNTLFATADEIIDTWTILQPVIDYWSTNQNDLIIYPNGSGELN